MHASHISAATSRRRLLLIVDGEPSIRALVGRIAVEFELRPVYASDEEGAIDALHDHRAEVIGAVVGSAGLSQDVRVNASIIHAVAPEVPLILMSGMSLSMLIAQPQQHILGYLLKPFRLDDLRNLLKHLLHQVEV